MPLKRGVGQYHHAQLRLWIKEPAVAVNPAPGQRAGLLRRLRRFCVHQQRPAKTESPAWPLRLRLRAHVRAAQQRHRVRLQNTLPAAA